MHSARSWIQPSNWRAWLVVAGFVLLGAGFAIEHAWRTLPRAHAAELLGIAALALALAAAAHRLWRIALADALLGVFALALLAFAGPVPALAALLLASAALGLGAAVTHARSGAAAAAVAGAGLLAGTLGWLLPFPVHFRIVYFCLLLGIVVATRMRLRTLLAEAAAAWRNAVDADPGCAAFAMLAAGLASAGCWVPTVQFDDVAYHLGLPTQLTTLGYYRMDAHSQIWALAPWSADVLHGIAQVLSGAEARGAVDACWLAALLSLAWQLAAALDLPLRARWLCAALIASQPLTAALAGGMQAELPATAASLALALTVARAPLQAQARVGAQFALLAAVLLALKTGFIAIILPLLLCLLWRWRRTLTLRGGAMALALVALVAGSSYVYAYALTGNPLFPILNAYFQSPLMDPINLNDPRWSAPVGWDLPWRITFRSSEYAESWNGTAGFALLGLVGTLPVALARREGRWLAACALVAFGAAIGTVHYFRYAFPALMLLAPCMVAALFAALPLRIASVALSALVVLNLAYQGSAFWTLHSGAITREVAALSVEPVYATFAPERVLAGWLRTHDPQAHVLFCAWERPFAAELAGRGFTVANYDPEVQRAYRAAEDDASGAQWRALFARVGARYAVTLDSAISPALRAALSDAQRVQQVETASLWRLPQGTAATVDLTEQRDDALRVRP